MMKARVGHMRRAALLLVSAWMLVCATAAVAQGNTAALGADAIGPPFEVAVIRPASPDGRKWFGVRLDASGRLEGSSVTLNTLVWVAYPEGTGTRAVATDRGAPKWVDSEVFDINGKVDESYMGGWDKLSDHERMDLVRPMLRRLLADRFHLKLNVEMRKTPVYALVQAKGGAHVKEVPAPVPVEGDPTEAVQRWTADHPGGEAAPGQIMCGAGDKCIGSAVKISDAIGQIQVSSGADRMVIDETGLKGYYDLSFRFALPHDSDETPMHALEDDLGMRFEPRSVPVKTYVIESADKPSVAGT